MFSSNCTYLLPYHQHVAIDLFLVRVATFKSRIASETDLQKTLSFP